jgi:hypothetical protein
MIARADLTVPRFGETSGDESALLLAALRFDSPDDSSCRWSFGALRQSRRFHACTGGFA